MKICFIFPNLGNVLGFNIGISVLSAILKAKNHDVKLIHLNEAMGFPLDFARISDIITDYKPDLIGVSVTTNEFRVGIKIAQFIKSKIDKKIPIVFGGIHPTLAPEEVLNYDCVDMVVVGEGEDAILELVESLDKGLDISVINNVWLRREGRYIKNKLRGFILLKEIPFMDTQIWEYQKMIDLRNGWIDVMVNRGCAYNCAYCFNTAYRNIYAKYSTDKLARYLRKDDYSKIIEGIKRIVSNYKNIKCISFVDDDFLSDHTFIEFIKMFKKEINLPFVINTHVNSVNLDKITKLEECGCDLIRIGIESGDELIRKSILNRKVTNAEIKEKITSIKEHGIRVSTYNMIGLPYEKREDVNKTLKLNSGCEPDVVKFSTFLPYPGTQLYTVCKDGGLLTKNPEEAGLTFFASTILNFDDDFRLFLEKVQRYADCYLNYFNEKLSVIYGPLIEDIENLSRGQFENKATQEEISRKQKLISGELSAKNTRHYKMKYTHYYAVLE